MCTYEIKANEKFNSSEIYFNEKPEKSILESLKANKFRWNPKKGCWYGFFTADDVKSILDGEKITSGSVKTHKEVKNKFGVKVGDYFSASWGYDQTNVDFFQVVALVGESSVRVREVRPQMIEENPTCGMAADRTYKLDTSVMAPPVPHSVFIKDNVNGDLKRLKNYRTDIVRPQFYLSGFADAHYESSDTVTHYESWYR